MTVRLAIGPIFQDPRKGRLFKDGYGHGPFVHDGRARSTPHPGFLAARVEWWRDGSREQPNVFLQREPAKSPDVELRELRKIVSELVALLNGKNILDDSEGMALLRKLSK